MADAYERASTELSVIVPEVWSANYYSVLLANLPFKDVISKDWEGEIANLGDTVHISTFPEFSAAVALTEGSASDAAAVTVTQQDLVIDQHISKDFIITKKALLQSLPAMEKLKELAIYAIMKKIESVIVAAIVPSAAAPDHTLAYGSGTTLQLSDLLAGKELLDAQDVPMADRHLVVGPAQLNDIFNITGFTSSDFLVDGAPVQTGQLPSALLGFAPHFTTQGGTNVTYLFHASFMTMASQQGLNVEEVSMSRDGTRATRVNIDTLFGVKQLANKRVVTIS